MALGAIFQAAKGVKDNQQYKSKITELKKEASKYSTPQKMLDAISDPFERIIAENQLLYANYLIIRAENKANPEKIERAWIRVKNQMNENLKKAEEQLKKQSANKHDIAKLIVGLSQISGELDKELVVMKDDFSKRENHLKLLSNKFENELNEEKVKLDESISKSIQSVQSNLTQYTEVEFTNIKKEIADILKEQMNDIDLNIEKKLEPVVKDFEHYKKVVNDKLLDMNNAIIDQKDIMNKIDEKLEKKDLQVHHKLHQLKNDVSQDFEKLGGEMTKIQQNLTKEVENLEASLNRQETAMYTIKDNLEKQLISIQKQHEENFTRQRKFILALNIPLYVISIVTLCLSIYMITN